MHVLHLQVVALKATHRIACRLDGIGIIIQPHRPYRLFFGAITAHIAPTRVRNNFPKNIMGIMGQLVHKS